MLTPDDLLLAWAAGFFDGEGCILVELTKTPSCKRGLRTNLRVSATQTSKPCLERFVERFGGTVRTFKHTTPNSTRWAVQHTWSLSGEKALDFLRLIEPYLIVKKTQAQLALEYPIYDEAGHKLGTKGLGIADEIHDKRLSIAYKLRDIRASMKEAALPGKGSNDK